MTEQEKVSLQLLSARIGQELTEEQMEFASDFTSPLISFSNPGTGKSFTTVAGLIIAQTIHGIPGKKINAMSFTNAATAELKAKYVKACKKTGLTPTVQFNTFHSICYSIVKEVYPNMRIRRGNDWKEELPLLATYMEQYGVNTTDMSYVRCVLEAINSLNSALIFDELNVEHSFKFKQLGLNVETFQNLRREWFLLGACTLNITQGDIPVYALFVLETNKAVQQKYHEKYHIMVVDEFQDLSLLHLKILSLITHNLVAIGDMKQQIYAFNGASQQIVDEYLKMYPNAKRQNLTKSFRCTNEIAQYATNLIYLNDHNVKAFEGIRDGGNIKVIPDRDLNLKEIVASIKEEQMKIGYTNFRDTMFLFRNNSSAVPLAEELYKQGVPFRMNKFAKVMDLPIFKQICELARIVENPSSEQYLQVVPKLFPEFRRYNAANCPLLIGIHKSGKSIFDINYAYEDASSIDILNAMKRAAIVIERGESAGRVFNALLPVYEKYIIEGKWWLLQYDKEYYYDLVSDIVNNKTFRQMIAEEYDKERRIKDCINANIGVRCYTVHSAKGLEADDVYILDAEDGVFPNSNVIKRYIAESCEYEAAKELRNERNLLYVAVTRAKENVYISYHSNLTELIANSRDNSYSYLDNIYNNTKKDYDDVGAFVRLFNLKSSNNITYDNDDTKTLVTVKSDDNSFTDISVI